MANILVGKGRYQSRSQREQDKAQGQITTFAIRYWADQALKEEGERLRCLGKRMESRVEVAQDLREIQMDNYIETVYQLVERVMQV
jgi:hypothetical protein